MNELQTLQTHSEIQIPENTLTSATKDLLMQTAKNFTSKCGIKPENLPEGFFEDVSNKLLTNEKVHEELQKPKVRANVFSLLMDKALHDDSTMNEILPYFNKIDVQAPDINKEFRNALNKSQTDFNSTYSVRKSSKDSEMQNMNRMRIKSRYAGLQEILEMLGKNGCYFLNLCTIIEEVNGIPLDLIEITRDCIDNGWIDSEWQIGYEETIKILNKYTGKNWKGFTAVNLPQNIAVHDNVFFIECHMLADPRFYKTIHTTRYYVDVSDKGEQKDIGIHLYYFVFKYE